MFPRVLKSTKRRGVNHPYVALRLVQNRPFRQSHVTFITKQEGLDLMNKGKINEASQIFQQLVNSGDPEVIANQALCICQIPSRAVEAESLAAKAVALAPDQPIYQVIQAHVLREVGKADLAVKNLLILQDFYVMWELQYALGRALNRNWQRYGPAIIAFNKSLELNPGNPDAYYWRGEAQFWLDSCHDDPFEWMKDEKYGDNIRAPYYRGLKSYKEERFDTALGYFEETPIAWRNDTSDVWSWKGEANLSLGKLDEALACFDKAVALNPADALSVHGQGAVWAKRGDPKGQELQFKALEMNRLYWKSDYFRVKKPAIEGA